MAKVFLTPLDKQLAIKGGKAIYDNKKKNGYFLPSVGTKHSALYYDILGVAGEIAVYRYLKLPFEFELYAVRDAGDLQLGAFCFDIKTKPYNGYVNDWLEVPAKHTENPKKNHINAYILVNHDSATSPVFDIVGWTSRPAHFSGNWQKHTYQGKEDRPVYRLHREHLSQPDMLFGYTVDNV